MNIRIKIEGKNQHIHSTLKIWREQGVPFIIYVYVDDASMCVSSRKIISRWDRYLETSPRRQENSCIVHLRGRDVEVARLMALTERFTVL